MIYIISKQKNERELFRRIKEKGWCISEGIPELIAEGSRLFFYHYSRKIPPEIYEKHECIGFHMTDLPFGRGGSPIQNLIYLGFTESVLTAFRITGEIDAGDVYLKMPISLEGTVDEILERGVHLATEMIKYILENNPRPEPQKGDIVTFSQRIPAQSILHHGIRTLPQLYDHIRMLDGEGYPHACLRYSWYRMEFTDAKLEGDRVRATVTFTEAK